jgi:hypothetical protein
MTHETILPLIYLMSIWTIIGFILFYSFGQNVFSKKYSKIKSLLFFLVIGPSGWVCLSLYTLGYFVGKSTSGKKFVL